MVVLGYDFKAKETVITQTQLTAPGSGETIQFSGCKTVSFQYKIASINTDVVVRAEGSHDDTTFYNLDSDEADTTQAADGTYAFYWEGELPFVRFTWVSEDGGTAATIDVKIFLG